MNVKETGLVAIDSGKSSIESRQKNVATTMTPAKCMAKAAERMIGASKT